jgi:aminomethyltransferase
MSTATLARTPFHPWSAERGARFVDFAGWEMPMSYGSIIDEHHACRTGAAFFDVSHMGRLRITGRHARKFLDRVCTRLILGMERGQVRYSLVCNERGGVRDDVLVYCYDEDDYMMVVNASNRLKILDWFRSIKERENLTFSMEDVTAETAMAAIQGPKVMELVAGFSREIPTLKRYRFAEKSLMIAKLTVSRTGYTGEDGVELVMGSTVAKFVLPMLLREKEGVTAAVRPCGLGARDSLRTEASMPLYGHEITEEIDPLSAGLGFAVKLDKGAADEREGRFIGQDALEAIAKSGTKHKLVGFEVEGRRAARQGMGIHRGGEHVGHVTSGCLSPTLDKVIAMGYVPSELAAEGTEFEIDLGKAKTAAKVVKMPFYNPVRGK